MFQGTALLDKILVKNFLSLRDVEIPLKPLTVLVGPNACGKSNVIRALRFLRKMRTHKELPSVKTFRESLWAGEADHIAFELQATLQKSRIDYELTVEAEAGALAATETLSVNDVQVLSTRNGEGWTQDEGSQKAVKNNSDEPAVSSVDDYRNKPTTRAFAQSVQDWQFYDFRPDLLWRGLAGLPSVDSPELREIEASDYPSSQGNRRPLSHDLWDWYNNDRERFEFVNRSLQRSMNLGIDRCDINGDNQFCLIGKHAPPIPLTRASDGTLRLLGYHILLNLPNPPSLIVLEEPERNMHPGALMAVADCLERIAICSQVIITTHSSQLLDTFDPDSLSDSLNVLLLNNPLGRGTEILNIEDIRGNRPALDGWIIDFGVGSGVFHSGLLSATMEESG